MLWILREPPQRANYWLRLDYALLFSIEKKLNVIPVPNHCHWGQPFFTSQPTLFYTESIIVICLTRSQFPTCFLTTFSYFIFFERKFDHLATLCFFFYFYFFQPTNWPPSSRNRVTTSYYLLPCLCFIILLYLFGICFILLNNLLFTKSMLLTLLSRSLSLFKSRRR